MGQLNIEKLLKDYGKEITEANLRYLKRLLLATFAEEHAALKKKLNAPGWWMKGLVWSENQHSNQQPRQEENAFFKTLNEQARVYNKSNKNLNVMLTNLYQKFLVFLNKNANKQAGEEFKKLFERHTGYNRALMEKEIKEEKKQEKQENKGHKGKEEEPENESKEAHNQKHPVLMIEKTIYHVNKTATPALLKAKVDMLDTIFLNQDVINGDPTARFGYATGVKAIRSLSDRAIWLALDNEGPDKTQLADDYFSKVHNIFQTRLGKNRPSRVDTVNNFYEEAKTQMDKFYSENLLDEIVKVIKSDFDNCGGKPGIRALQYAQKQLSMSASYDVRSTFYSDLREKLNKNIDQSALLKKVQKMIIVLKTANEVNNPARKKHAKLGRATGVAKLKRFFGKPVELVKDLWDKVDDFFDRTKEILTARIQSKNTKTSRNKETTNFYYDSLKQINYVELLRGLEEIDSNEVMTVDDEESVETVGEDCGVDTAVVYENIEDPLDVTNIAKDWNQNDRENEKNEKNEKGKKEFSEVEKIDQILGQANNLVRLELKPKHFTMKGKLRKMVKEWRKLDAIGKEDEVSAFIERMEKTLKPESIDTLVRRFSNETEAMIGDSSEEEKESSDENKKGM